MSKVSPLFSWMACYGAPIMLAVIAIKQQWHVHVDGLTPWLGGGMGMFAKVDRVDHRVVRVTLLLEDGRWLPARIDDWDELHALRMATAVMPTQQRIGRLARVLEDITWTEVPAEGTVAAHAKPEQESASGRIECLAVKVLRITVHAMTLDPETPKVALGMVAQVDHQVASMPEHLP